MTNNEKKILAIIHKDGPMSKRDIQSKSGLSWSTVVKIVSRLLDNKLIVEKGIGNQSNVQGKDPVLYDLNEKFPLIVSVDVEYSKTQILLTNLKNNELASKTINTLKMKNKDQLIDFLQKEIQEFINQNNLKSDMISGVGICIPLFIIPHNNQNFYSEIEECLSSLFNVFVAISSPTQGYTYYLLQKLFERKNSLVLVNRGGLGAGIILEGKLYTGERQLAGEIGHLTSGYNEIKCKCGKIGCLETVVDKRLVYDRYQKEVINLSKYSIPTNDQYNKAMENLILLWENDHIYAHNIIEDIIDAYSNAICTMNNLIDINDIYIIGYFSSKDGRKLIKNIKEKVKDNMFITREINIFYESFEEKDFLKMGPAHKIFEQYFEV